MSYLNLCFVNQWHQEPPGLSLGGIFFAKLVFFIQGWRM
ncbi:hypothetical protein NSP_25170 [Nodularia spumigena CCY9414]|nr:hypothetical protein NSP_25170 [Nodularia spumigena CCY9414]